MPGGLAREFPDQIAVAAQRERKLVTVGGRRQDLGQALHQHEHMRCGVAFDTDHRAGRVGARSAETGQDGLLLVREQRPEALGRRYPVQVHITVGGLSCRPVVAGSASTMSHQGPDDKP